MSEGRELLGNKGLAAAAVYLRGVVSWKDPDLQLGCLRPSRNSAPSVLPRA